MAIYFSLNRLPRCPKMQIGLKIKSPKMQGGNIFDQILSHFYLCLYLFISITVSASPGDKVKNFYQNKKKHNAQRHTNT